MKGSGGRCGEKQGCDNRSMVRERRHGKYLFVCQFTAFAIGGGDKEVATGKGSDDIKHPMIRR
jgi:hypothetical protein